MQVSNEQIAKMHKPEFKDFMTTYSFTVGNVLLTDDDGLGWEEKRSFSCRTRAVCVLSIRKITNKKKILQNMKKTRKYLIKVPYSKFATKWYKSFSKKQIKALFERYYVAGYEDFCLALTPENKENLAFYKFLLPDYLLKYSSDRFTRDQAKIGAEHYYAEWIDIIRGEFGNRSINKSDFLEFIKKIREIAEIFEQKSAMEYRECKKLNQVMSELPKEIDITTDILNSFFESLTKDLLKNRAVCRCQFCKNFFIYKKHKKYCSLLSEGKDCGKQVRNRRYYMTKGKKRLPKYRKATRELRAFYREKGIKK